jgi:multiple sugar transport system ATP-binding protein
LLLPLGPKARPPAGTRAVYGIRPEHLVLDPEGVPFSIEIVEPTGSETHAQGKLGRHPFAGLFRERIDLAPGETIRVAPRPGTVHLFEAASALRIE